MGKSALLRKGFLLAFALFTSSAMAQMGGRYVVPDREQDRPFIVALDELQVINAARGPREYRALRCDRGGGGTPAGAVGAPAPIS